MLNMNNVCFAFDQKNVLQNLSLELQKGEIVAVMGPSGCGKTTLLGLVAGLHKPQKGDIENTFEKIAYAFQEPRLFPWLTVKENLLAVTDGKDADNAEVIEKYLSLVELTDSADKYPNELSGGMKSRVSLARALVFGGDLFLFDEPFAALDEVLRHTLSLALKKHLKESGAAAILVTHSYEDAEMIADRIITLS